MQQQQTRVKMVSHSSALYGIGFIGALVYYIKTATSFWMGMFGFLKACFWPAMLVYKLMEFLKM